MTCQEVMDDMQRKLDDDLDEQETRALMDHIASCPDCAAMYERLQALSSELENLPKVMPKYSLVDAIMPQLEQIDRAVPADRAEPDAAGGPTAGGEAEPGRLRSRKRRWTQRLSVRALSGVIAAGVVVGLFIVTYDPERTSDTADRSLAVESGDASTMSVDDQSGEPASGSAQERRIMMKDGDAADDAAAGNAGGAPASDGADGETLHEDAGASTPASDPQAPPSSSGTAAAGASGVKPDGTQTPPSGAPEREGTGETPDASDAPAAGGAQEDADGGEPEVRLDAADASSARTGEAPDEESGEMANSLNFMLANVELESPNGAYKAVALGAKVVIYDTGGGDGVLYESRERTGGVALESWSDDSRYFDYSVTNDDGSVEMYRIDLQEGTETKQ